MELGLETLAAGGATMVGTLQGGRRETTRFEPERDDARSMTDKPAFQSYLSGVRKLGMTQFARHLADSSTYQAGIASWAPLFIRLR